MNVPTDPIRLAALCDEFAANMLSECDTSAANSGMGGHTDPTFMFRWASGVFAAAAKELRALTPNTAVSPASDPDPKIVPPDPAGVGQKKGK